MFHSAQINPIYRKGKNGAAVLLLHGFTGTPDVMRPLANALHEKGFTIFAPLMAGHGTTWENLEKSTWEDWYAGAERAFAQLRREHAHVGVTGLSLGGILALKLAEEHADGLKALACLATPIKLKTWVHWAVPLIRRSPFKRFYRYQKKMDIDVKDPEAKKNIWDVDEMPLAGIENLIHLQKVVAGRLTKITTPTLLIHGRRDSTAPYENMGLIARGLSSAVTETVTLENSYHLVTVDYDKELVCAKVGEFFVRHVVGG